MDKTYAECLMEIYGAPESFIDIFEKLRKKEDWEALSANMTFYKEWLPVTFEAYYRDVPDDCKYDFLIDVYAHGGDSIPAIRKEVRKAKQYGTSTLPPEFDGQDVITVYRAGDEPIGKAPYRLSWTTDRDRAEWFMVYSGLRKMADMHLYQAEIRRDKIIGYTDIREEKEVIQYRGVKAVKEIGFMTHKEVVDKWAESREKNAKTG